jgi:hypothetical protein
VNFRVTAEDSTLVAISAVCSEVAILTNFVRPSYDVDELTDVMVFSLNMPKFAL